MVAIFTGFGSGFERGSGAALGGVGLLGGGAQGRGGEHVSVNAANGNLILSRQDEFLVGRGLDVGISRTYNSRGALDENGDHWRQSTDRRVFDYVAGVSVKRVSADGSEITYNHVSGTTYKTTDGSGSHDTLTLTSNAWTWKDGSSQITEKYGASGTDNWRITEQKDTDGNKISFTYSGTKLTKITTADGGYLKYTWSGNNITSVETYANGGTTKTLTRTRYTYDSYNRLKTVTTDLSPENNSVADGKKYVTTYTYSGSSKLITRIAQTDGSRLDIAYNASGMVTSLKQTAVSGDIRETTVTYSSSGYTRIYDPSGVQTRLYHDAKEQLTQIRTYTPSENGTGVLTNYFTYDADGNVKTVKDAEDKITSYNYDANGNVTRVTDPTGRITNNIYDTKGNLTRVQAERSNESSSNIQGYDRFVYDGESHLRYAISANGNVTEYIYQGTGQLTYTKQYTEISYSTGSAIPTLTQMDAWRNGLADRTQINIVRNIYDAKGQMTRSINYGAATTTGGASSAEGHTDLRFIYDSAGRLLSSKTTASVAETYVYDGLGRLTASTDINGGTTTIVFNDAATKTVITSAGGHVTTNTYNKAGNLISKLDSGAFDTTGTSTYKYDKNGRLRMVTDATGLKSYFVYDKAGRLTAEVNHYGYVTEYQYDKNGRQTASARYTRYKATAARNTMLVTLSDPNNTLKAKDLLYSTNTVTNNHSYDIWQWTAYDAKGQVTRTALGDGSITTYAYDKAGRLVKTYGYVNKLNATQLAALRAGTKLSSTTLPGANSSKDVVIRTFYDRDGRVVGALNGKGHLSRIYYDKAGQVIHTVAYGNPTSTSLRATGTFNQLYASFTKSSTKDAHVRSVYDGQGHLRFSIDALGKVTEYQYGSGGYAIGLLRTTIQHTATLPSLSNYKLSTVKTAVAALGSTSTNRKGWAVYNTRQQLVYSIDSLGAVTRFQYDTQGNVIRTYQYSITRTTTSLPSESSMNSWHSGKATTARITRNYYSSGGLLRFVIDAEGYVTQTTYDKEGRVYDKYSYANKLNPSNSWTTSTVNSASKGTSARTQYRYDLAGRLSSVYNANNTRHYYGYFANGEIAWEIRAYGSGRDESRAYYTNDAAGRRVHSRQYSTAYSGTRLYSYTAYYYDGLGNLTRSRDLKGNHAETTAERNTYFTYDKNGQVLTRKDAENGTVSYQYNAFGNVTRVTDALNNQTNNTYDKGGRLTRSTDALGYHTDTTYTAFNEVYTLKRNNATTRFYYDNRGQTTRVKDALGKSEYFTYDAYGQQVTVKNKLGGFSYSTYDKRGQLTSTKVNGNVYNSAGSLVASFSTTNFEYDSRGNRTKMIEAANRIASERRTTTYVYDSINQLIQKKSDSVSIYTSGADSTASTVIPTEYYTYDRRGNLIESENANGARTLYFYDKADRVTHQISPEGTLVRNAYDYNGNLLETKVYTTKVTLPANALGTPPNGSGTYRRTTFTYDRLGQMTNSYVRNVQTAKFGTSLAITSTSNNLHTQYIYDKNGNVTKVIDPNGGETTSTYDKLGRKTRQYDAGNFRTDWVYNADGNVTKETRFGNAANPTRVTNFVYDLNGRRTSETRTGVKIHNGSGGHSTVNSTISYLYNALGQVTRKTEATGDKINYVYDTAGRLTSENRTAYTNSAGNSVTPTVNYYYNALNDLARTRKKGTTGVVSHAYAKYNYSAGGRLDNVVDANGFTRIYRYDKIGQLVREEYVRVTNSGNKTEGIGYDFDKEGRVIAQGAVAKSGSTWSRGGNSLDTVNTKYNAFGDVSERGINGKYSEKLDYDKAGRLWRTNSGDGAYKYFMYDNNGNQTLVFTSDGTNIDNKSITQVLALWGVPSSGGSANKIWTDYKDGLTATITKYDARNLATEVREPERQINTTSRHDLLTKRSYNAFGEVISETDANNKTINYTYNTMGRRIEVKSPTVSVTNEAGVKSNVRPTEHYYYDVSGRLVASKDANGNLTRQTLLSGTGYGGTQALITQTIAADGGRVSTAYDIQGNARKVTTQLGHTSAGVVNEALGYTTVNSFDKLGRVTQVNHAGGLVDSYAYDGLGQQTSHSNNQLTTTVYTGSGPVWVPGDNPFDDYDDYDDYGFGGGGGGNDGYWYYDPADYVTVGDASKTDYDAQGRVISQRAIGGDTTTNTYVWNAGLSTSGLGTFGGWVQTTTFANSKTLTAHKDVFGHGIYTNDLGGRITNTTYNKAGRAVSSSGSGTDTQAYAYLNTGKLDTLTISGTNYNGGYYNVNSVSRVSQYKYDKVGNLLNEKLTETTTVTYTYGGYYYGEELETGSYTTTSILQNSTATYDALGRLKTWNESGSGATTPPASKIFEYDAQGNIRRTQSTYRALDAQGVAATANTVKNSWYRFDSMNRVVTSEGQLISGQITRGLSGVDIYYDKAGQRAYTLKDTLDYQFNGYVGTTITTKSRENYTYNKAGQVTLVKVASTTDGSTPGSTGIKRSALTYDLMGRQTGQIDYEANGITQAFSSTKAYNNKSQITNDTSNVKKTDGSYKTITSYYYGGGTTYALGAAISVTTRNYAKNSATTVSATSSTTNTYGWYSGAVLTATSFKPNTSQSTTHTTSYTNSKSGVLLSARITDGRSRTVTFTNDNNGQVIRRDERDNNTTNGDPHEIWYRFGGKEMGYVGNNGTSNKNYASTIAERQIASPTAGNIGAFRNGSTIGSNYSDFDGAYAAINSYKQGSTGGSYTVRGGESLQSIAQNIYGDSSLWYKLAAANGLSGETPLIQGQSLILPSGVVKSTHNASTFKPYAPGETQGDLNPTTPQPQQAGKKGKCGVIGVILLVVVAVVVTIATSGAAAGFFGSASAAAGSASAVGAAAGGGFAGALAGAGAALGGASLGVSGLAAVAIGAGAAAAGSIASQAFGVVTGIQEKFSWKGVALAALSGGIGAGLGDKALNAFGSVKNAAVQAGLRAAAGSAISQGLGVATGLQDKFSWAGVAAAGAGAAAASAFSGTADKLGKSLGRQVSGKNAEVYFRVSRTATKALTGVAASIANAATRSALEGTSFADNIVAAIPDVVGNAIVNFSSACFVGETLVHTPKGMKRIDEIKIGDWVYSRDEHFNNETVHRNRVIKLYQYENRKTLDVTISFEDGSETTMRTTPEHPFAVVESDELVDVSEENVHDGDTLAIGNVFAWRAAGDLSFGDRTVDINGNIGLVTELTDVDKLSTVHNFSVEGDHTYFVGDIGVWVHNDYLDKIMRMLMGSAQADMANAFDDLQQYKGSSQGYNDLTAYDRYSPEEQSLFNSTREAFGYGLEVFDKWKNDFEGWVGGKWKEGVNFIAKNTTTSVLLSKGAEFAENRGMHSLAKGLRLADEIHEGVLTGFGNGVGSVLGGIGHMVLNPVDTLGGLITLGKVAWDYGRAVARKDTNVLADLGNLKDAYAASWEDGYSDAVASGGDEAGVGYVAERAAGIVTEIAALFLGGAGAWSKIGKLRGGKNLSRLVQGIVYEAKAAKAAAKRAFQPNRSTQSLSVRAYGPDGKLMEGRTVLDQAGFRKDTGEFGALEFKLSKNAPYTKRQKEHFPNLELYGGVVVGKKGVAIGLPAGSRLDPLGVVRHNGPKVPKVWW